MTLQDKKTVFLLKQHKSKCHIQGPVANDMFDAELSDFVWVWFKAIFSTHLPPRYKITAYRHNHPCIYSRLAHTIKRLQRSFYCQKFTPWSKTTKNLHRTWNYMVQKSIRSSHIFTMLINIMILSAELYLIHWMNACVIIFYCLPSEKKAFVGGCFQVSCLCLVC